MLKTNLIENGGPVTTTTPGCVVCIKFVNGEEIIAKVVACDSGSSMLTVSKPYVLALIQDPATGNAGVQLLPFWMTGANQNETYNINTAHAICIVKASKEVNKAYTDQTSSIIMPKSSSGIII